MRLSEALDEFHKSLVLVRFQRGEIQGKCELLHGIWPLIRLFPTCVSRYGYLRSFSQAASAWRTNSANGTRVFSEIF